MKLAELIELLVQFDPTCEVWLDCTSGGGPLLRVEEDESRSTKTTHPRIWLVGPS